MTAKEGKAACERIMRHTPGPWRFTERSMVTGSPSHLCNIPFAIEKAHFNSVLPIADICNFPPATYEQTEYQRANARLIAAAPDMLDALYKAVDLLNRALPIVEGESTKTANDLQSGLQDILLTIDKATKP